MSSSHIPFLKNMSIQRAKDGSALALTITVSEGSTFSFAIKTDDCLRLAAALTEQARQARQKPQDQTAGDPRPS